MSTLYIIVAGGSGSRFGADMPKQYCLLAGRPVVFRAIDALRAAASPADRFVAVIAPSMAGLWHELEQTYGPSGAEMMACGGASRAATVAAALRATAGYEADIIAIHDGARPLVDAATVMRAVEAAATHTAGAVAAVAVTDSLRHITTEGASEAVDRSAFRAVQTPQAFPAATIRAAYEAMAGREAAMTDDASVVEAATGMAPLLTEGSPENIKITNPADLAIAEAIISLRRS